MDNSFLEKSLFNPDISARRVCGLMKFFLKERKSEDHQVLGDILEEEDIQRIFKDKNLWISQELEEKIIGFLSSQEDISPALYQIGKETFLAQAYDLLPTDLSSISIHDFILRIPLLLFRLTRSVRVDVVGISSHSANFSFVYEGRAKEKWYDVIFFKGMLDGLSMLFELEGFKTILESTKLLGIHIQHKDLGENIRFGADSNSYRIEWTSCKTKVGKTNLDKSGESKSQKTFVITRESEDSTEEYSVMNLSGIIHKSRELALENRDLEAAVEILKSFKTELEIKQRSIAKDLKLAKNIQQGLIPQSIPDWKGIQFWFHFQPMQEVSGDYFDYFPLSDEKMGIALCDVSGHGVPAAFITALSKMLFSTYKSFIPSNIFKKVNRDLLELLQYQGYTTCVYSIIDSNYNVVYSVAGHPRPIYYQHSTGKVISLKGEGTFLGMFPEANDFYEDNRVQLYPGDKIFIYTDGVTEALNEEGTPYGEERLISIIEETKGLSVKESINYIINDLNQFTMGTDQGDDITILGYGLSSELQEFERLSRQGLNHYRNKFYSQASECFLKALDIMPREMNNILYLSKSLAKEGNFRDAIEHLQEYNQYKLHDYESHFILGYCYFMSKEWEKAESEFRRAIYMDDSHPSVYYNLIRVYAKLKDWDKFSSYLNKMKKNFPVFNRFKELESLLYKEGGIRG